MGDDLMAARRFSKLCYDRMATLLSGDTQNSTFAIQALSDIQREAKRVHARAIYRVAQNAIEDYQAARSKPQSYGSLLALNKLILQYCEGLNEILPFKSSIPGLTAADSRVSDIIQTDALAFSKAQTHLASVIKFAPKGTLKASLHRLTQFVSDDFIPNVPANKAEQASAEFEDLMPSLTDELLRCARQTEKSVSVSYACDEIHIETALVRPLNNVLGHVCKTLIDHTAQTPIQRQAQGLSQTAHLAITARSNGPVFDVLISCEGPAPLAASIKLGVDDSLKAYGLKLQIGEDNGITKIELRNIQRSVAAPAPITTQMPSLEKSA